MLLAPRASVASLQRFLRVPHYQRLFCTTNDQPEVEKAEPEATGIEAEAESVEPVTEEIVVEPIKLFELTGKALEPKLGDKHQLLFSGGQLFYNVGLRDGTDGTREGINTEGKKGGLTSENADKTPIVVKRKNTSLGSKKTKKRRSTALIGSVKNLSAEEKEWHHLAQDAEDFLGETHVFMEDLDRVIETCCLLPGPTITNTVVGLTNISKRISDSQKVDGSSSAISTRFQDVRGKFEVIYRDHLLSDIEGSTVVAESGDKSYLRMAIYKVVLGDMLSLEYAEDGSSPNGFNNYETDARGTARTLKEALASLSESTEMKNLSSDKEDSHKTKTWNHMLKKVKKLNSQHAELNIKGLNLVNRFEATQKKFAPDSPRNDLEKGDLVRYYVPAIKQWVAATVLEAIGGPGEPTKIDKESMKEIKYGKLKLQYEREFIQNGESKKITKTKWISKWHSNVQPKKEARERWRHPSLHEQRAIELCSWFQAVKYDVPIEAPLRLPQFYHQIDDIAYPKEDFDQTKQNDNTVPATGNKFHLMQKYYLDQYLPASHPARLRHQDKTCGRDPYRDRFIQRDSDSSRIMNSALRFDHYHKHQHLLGGDQPLLNFFYLTKYKNHDQFRMAIARSNAGRFGKHKENYEMNTYHRYGYNFKVTSNRTLDMFNARGFDLKYSTERVL